MSFDLFYKFNKTSKYPFQFLKISSFFKNNVIFTVWTNHILSYQFSFKFNEKINRENILFKFQKYNNKNFKIKIQIYFLKRNKVLITFSLLTLNYIKMGSFY